MTAGIEMILARCQIECMSKRQRMEAEGGGGGGRAAAVQAHGTFSVNLEQHKRVLTEVFVHVSEE